MNTLFLMTTMMVLIFTCRWAGFVWNVSQTSPFWESFLQRVPISLFTVLVLAALYKETDLLTMRLFALMAAGGIIWRTRHFSLSFLVGLSVLWILMLICFGCT